MIKVLSLKSEFSCLCGNNTDTCVNKLQVLLRLHPNHNLIKIYTVIRSTLDKTFSHLQIYCYLSYWTPLKSFFNSWVLSKQFCCFYNAHLEYWHPSYKIIFLNFLLFFFKKKRLTVILWYFKKKYEELWATLSILLYFLYIYIYLWCICTHD